LSTSSFFNWFYVIVVELVSYERWGSNARVSGIENGAARSEGVTLWALWSGAETPQLVFDAAAESRVQLASPDGVDLHRAEPALAIAPVPEDEDLGAVDERRDQARVEIWRVSRHDDEAPLADRHGAMR
jgi:hypothetical protein